MFGAALLLLQSLVAASSLDATGYGPGDIIERDVAIVGGGSAGIYSAVRLVDQHKSVIVIEQKGVIGGHTETYTDPATGTNLNLGVILFQNTSIVRNYFQRLHVPLIPSNAAGAASPVFVDFSTGKTIDYHPPSVLAFGAALIKYSKQLQKYPELQKGFNLTYPVHPDLLLPFGKFVTKYGLEDLFPIIFLFNQGYVPFLDQTTLYIFKYLNSAQVTSFITGYVTAGTHNTHDLYAAAAKVLTPTNILTHATILKTSRSRPHGPVLLALSTPSGPKLIRARKLLLAAPPTPATFAHLDPSPAECALAAYFSSNTYITTVFADSGLHPNESLTATGPGQPANLPRMPGIYIASRPPGTALTQVYYGSATAQRPEAVQADIVAALQRRARALGRPVPHPRVVAYSDHAPFNMGVSTEAIQKGFYRRLLELQGQHGTFYVGAAWQTQDSSAIWAQIEESTLPRLLAQL